MITSFSEFIEYVANARFSFKYIWEWLVSLYYSITENADMLAIWDSLSDFTHSIHGFIPYALMILGFIVAMFGKKMGGVLKFVGFFVVGFALGVHFLAPVIPPELTIPTWVVGLIAAIVAAVVSKFLFVFTYSVAVLYSVYRLCYHGFFLQNETVFSTGKAITSLAVAAIVLVLSLIVFKFVEMLFFSLFGAWVMSAGFAIGIIDLGAIPKLGEYSWILEISVIGVIAVLTFLFQVRTRRRY